MLDLLAQNPLLLLFTVIGLGYLVGNISIFGFRLGVAAVLFVGIFFGTLDSRLNLPEHIYIIGLVLFVYAIGLQSGHGFFASFRKRGLRFSIISGLILLAGAAVTVIIKNILGLTAPGAAGLFCGALTNTPALAAVVEATKNLYTGLPTETYQQYISSPVVTYGLTYPFGVFGVILWFFISNRILKGNRETEESNAKKESEMTAIYSRTFIVTNPAVIGKTVKETLAPVRNSGFILSRIRKETGRTELIQSTTVLELNDHIVAVGNKDALERAKLIFGELSPENLVEEISDIRYRRIFVSNKAVAGKYIRDLHITRDLRAIITRLRRGDVDIVPTPDTILEMGDRIRVITQRDNMDRVTRYFGDSLKSVSETDYLSLSLGIVLGVFLGMIPIPLGHGLSFKLGFAGGPLVAGLILGRIERTGPIIWEMPFNANLVLRQVGLVFFLAGIGTKAGDGFGTTFQSGGWELIAAGAILTSFVTLTTILVGNLYLKLPMSAVMGMMSGIQTQPACLVYANQQTETDLPNIWYTTVYPASMVAKIILAQVILSILIFL
ncbi:MAG: transporter [Acidobacteria bacterium]|nr:transporter [Acidobacteriota bacterium]